MKIFLLFFIVICITSFISIKAQEQEITINKNQSIRITAPTGISNNMLGMAFDNNFNELGFKVVDGSINTSNQSEYSSEYKKIENYSELSANVKVFSLVKGGINKRTNKRYAILNIYSIDKTSSITPTNIQSSDADYYISKIHYGWSLNYVIAGDESIFTSEVSSNLQKWIGAGGDVKSRIKDMNLQQELKLIGLAGKEDGVILAKTPEETLNKFKKTKESIPILVEFKAIRDINTKGILWLSPTYSEGTYFLEKIKFKVSETKSSGHKWDAGIGNTKKPDVIIKIFLDDKNIYTGSANKNSFEGTIDISKNLFLNENSKFRFSFWDNDMSEDDFIGSVHFDFSNFLGKKLEKSISLNTTNSKQVKNCEIFLKKK